MRAAQQTYRHFAASSRRMADYYLRRLLRAFVPKGAPDLSEAVSITPTAQPRQTQPTKAERTRLAACPDLALRFVILACDEAALRSGTAIRVRPADRIAGFIAMRTKKGAVTKTPITPNLARVMDTLPADADPLVPYVQLLAGRSWSYPAREIQKRWARWKKKCGVRADLRLHDLRRGAARRLYRLTGDLRKVQSLLSHQALSATLTYLDAADRHVTVAELTAAAEMEQTL